MNKAAQFLRDCGTFFLATEDQGQPRVRPFGAVIEYEGKTWICTNNKKECFKQMIRNPKVEISASKGAQWIRICGDLYADSRREVKLQMLEEIPMLKSMYNEDDDIFEVMYLKDATATIYSFTAAPETFKV